MKSKEIYQAIDLSKVNPELKTKLTALEKATDGFTNERADANMDMAMNKIYDFLKDKKPESLKNIEVKTVEVEEKVETIVEGKPVKKTTKTKKKVAGKKKKVAKKTATPSSGLKKPTVSSVASKIRKPNESWSDALSRAKVIFNEKKQTQVAKTKKAVDDLRDFLKDDKNFTGWPRTYGKEKASDNSLERDSQRKAMPPGKRRSDTGRVYYENRDNRSDREANSFPRKIYLKEGGNIYNTRSLFELGGETMVEPTILQDNPNYLVGTESMAELFEKGGITKGGKVPSKSGKLKYDPTRDVVAIAIKDGVFNKMFTKGDFLGGAYQMESGGVLKDYNYVSPRNIIFARLKSGEDIKPVNGFYIRKNASGTVMTDAASKPIAKANVKSLNISIPRPILLTGSPSKSPQMMKFIGTFSSKDLTNSLSPAITFVQLKEGSIVATDAVKLIRIIDGSTLKENKLVCEAAKCKNQKPEDQKFPSVSQVINSIDSEFSESYDMVDLYKSLMQVRNDDLKNKVSKTGRDIELKLENQTIYFNITLLLQCVKGCLLLGWKKAFISYSQRPKAIVFTEEKAEGRVNEVSLILLAPIFGANPTEKVAITPKMLLEQGGIMADGGEVFIPTTYLDYNPDYLVGTNTMYEMFEKGGKIGFEGLSKKVAARYVGKSVKPKFQAEYGKTYSSEEAGEVGDKVAAKVYRQQQAKMAHGGMLEEQSLEMAQNISTQIAHHANELKESLVSKTYVEPFVTSMLVRAADNLSDATHYLEGNEQSMAKGGKIREFDDVLIISKNKLGMVEAIVDNIYYVTTPFGESFEAAIDDLQKVMSFYPGGSLQGHGFEVGDLIVEDLGGYIRVVSEDGKDFFITLKTGDRETEAPLPFKHGGRVKHSDVTRRATKTNEAGDEVVDLTEFYEGGGNVPKVFDVPAQFLDAEGKRKNDRETIKELTDFVLELPQTKEIYYNDELGDYTPSRKKLHAEIINKFKKEVVCINNDKPIAIFMGGSPASGKSSFLRKYSPFLLKEEILKIDADEIRAMLPEYEGWNASQTHLETKDIVNTLLSNKNIGIPCDFDIIYDGTMNSVKSYIPLMDILHKRGYKIFIVFMDNVPKDVIIKRALDRYKSSGRFVPLEVIEDFFSKGKSAFNELKKDVDGYMRIDGSSQDYKVLEEGGIKLPRDREYSKLGTKIKASDIPASYKKGGLSKLY